MKGLRNLYEVIDEIKAGKIFLVYDKIGKQVCVLKERNLESEEIYKRLKKLQSQFVPKIYRVVREEKKIYVVEEFIEGETLAENLKYVEKAEEKKVAEIFRQICEALKEMHVEKIIHRDLKPTNIMVKKNGEVKLIDFSISRIAKENAKSDTENFGTRGYAPPEQYGFGQTDARSDIFSLGKTFQKILGENYKGYLKKILKKCTELDPANRYQSVEEILSDIDKKFWQEKIKKFLVKGVIMSSIIMTVIIFPTNFFEEEKISEPVEEKIVEEKPEKIKNEPRKELPKTIFPEIKIPEITPEKPREKLEMPQSSEEVPRDSRLNQVCTLYLNNEIFNAEISKKDWENWRKEGDIIYLPADWKLSLKIRNKNAEALSDLKISIQVDGEEKIFSETIPANQSKIISVKLSKMQDGKSKIAIRLNSDKIFSWFNKSFGNYKEFEIYLEEWRVRK